jgi:hypothetical protein
MATGLLAPLYRAGLMGPLERSGLMDQVRRVRTFFWERSLGIRFEDGFLQSTSHLTPTHRWGIAARYMNVALAQVALDVASTYRGGDYFEFGSYGLGTFRNFLGAFYLNFGDTRLTDTKFYAFDIFGDPDSGSGAPSDMQDYFEHYRLPSQRAMPVDSLNAYGALKERCVLVPGYFQDTLSEDLKQKLIAEKRRIGFAFIDCNIAPSYKIVFDFLIDVLSPQRTFVYMDEYFVEETTGVHTLYRDFAEKAKERYGLDRFTCAMSGRVARCSACCRLNRPSAADRRCRADRVRPEFRAALFFFVMPGVVPGIHVFEFRKTGVDGRNKSGHDGLKNIVTLADTSS